MHVVPVVLCPASTVSHRSPSFSGPLDVPDRLLIHDVVNVVSTLHGQRLRVVREHPPVKHVSMETSHNAEASTAAYQSMSHSQVPEGSIQAPSGAWHASRRSGHRRTSSHCFGNYFPVPPR